MYGKLIISCKLRVLTGLHIGGSSVFSPIGAVDSTVIKDPITNHPIVPGSSLKGKMRSLLVKATGGDKTDEKKDSDQAENDEKNEKNDLNKAKNDKIQKPDPIKRIFGSVSPIVISRFQFADAHVSEESLKQFKAIGLTEIKFENTINRNTSEAMPRQIERVLSGVEFDVKIVYNIVNGDEMKEDLENLAKGMKLLQLDYLGGHGTRGSGRVSFKDIKVSPKFCDKDAENIIECIKPDTIFEAVSEYELLSV